MKKLLIASLTFSLLFSSSAMAESCQTLQNVMKSLKMQKGDIALTSRAEESVYYYFKLKKPQNGKSYLMIEMLADCYTGNKELISNKEFKRIKEAPETPLGDDEG